MQPMIAYISCRTWLTAVLLMAMSQAPIGRAYAAPSLETRRSEPPIQILAIDSKSGWDGSDECPPLSLMAMESLAPLRMELILPLNGIPAYHAIDGQSLFSGDAGPGPAYADSIFAQAALDAVKSARYDALWLIGNKFSEPLLQALRAARAAGKPLLVFNGGTNVLAGLGIAIPTPPAPPQETLAPAFTNWSFEQAGPPPPGAWPPYHEKDVPSGTWVVGAGEAVSRIGWADQGHTGGHSLKVYFPIGRNGVYVFLGDLALPPDVNLLGVPITISGWSKAEKGGGFSLYFFDRKTGTGAGNIGSVQASKGEWKPFTFITRLPAGKNQRLGIALWLASDDTIYVDDIQCTPANELLVHAQRLETLRQASGGALPAWETMQNHPLAGADLPPLSWLPLGLPNTVTNGRQPLVFSSWRDEAALATIEDGRGGKIFALNTAGTLLLRDGFESQDAWYWYRVCRWLVGQPLPEPRLTKSSTIPTLSITPTPTFTPPGQEVTLQIAPLPGEALAKTGPAGIEPATGRVVEVQIRDLPGRLLDRLTVSAEGPPPWETKWTVPDLGPNSIYFRAAAELRQGETILANATRSIYARRPFDPRERMFYGVWLNKTSQSDWVMRLLKRLYDHAGVDYMQMRKWALLERFGWFGQLEAGNGGIDIQFGWPKESFAEIPAREGKELSYAKTTVYNLISWGEEPGFGPAWGTTYWWDDGKVPASVVAWFHKFMRERYHNDIAALNRAWQTNFPDFASAPFSKAYAATPALELQPASDDIKMVMNQQKVTLDVGKDKMLPHLARYNDTRSFFTWHFDEVIAAMIADARTNYPWAQHFISAPYFGLFAPATPVPGSGNHPFYAKENPLTQLLFHRSYGYNNPPARLDWYFLDDPGLQANTLQQQLALGTSIFMAWFEMPLQFNFDLTSSQGGARMNRLLATLRERAEGPYLHNYYDLRGPVGILVDGVTSMYGITFPGFTELLPCVLQTGQMPRFVREEDIGDASLKVLFFRKSMVSKDTLAKLKAFVERGGTLVTLPGVGAWDEHGSPVGAYMHPDLVALCGVAPRYGIQNATQMTWRSDAPFQPAGGALTDGAIDGSALNRVANGPDARLSTAYERLTVLAKDTRVCAAYPDGTPAVTYRKVGAGRVIHLNTECGRRECPNWSHGNHPYRYAFTRLFRALFAESGLEEALPRLVNGSSDLGPHQVLWQRTQNVTKDVTYITAYTDPRAGELPARMLIPKGTTVRELMEQKDLAADADGSIPLHFAPGEFHFLAVRSADPASLKASADLQPDRHLVITAALYADRKSRSIWPGQRAVRVRFLQPDGTEAVGLRRWISVTGQATISHRVALDDAPGRWTVEVFEPIAGLTRTARFKAPGTEPRPEAVNAALYGGTPEETVGLLRQLTQVYATGTNRPTLSYYLHARGNDSRHALIRRLERLDWAAAEGAWRAALEAGETFMLTGEDLGRFPGASYKTQGLFENHALETLQRLVHSARSVSVPRDWPSTLICRIGKGRLILDRISLDETCPPNQEAGYFYPDYRPSPIGARVEKWRIALKDEQAPSASARPNLTKWIEQGRSSELSEGKNR